jgi:DNA-binding CsgD family transcriptional regulator
MDHQRLTTQLLAAHDFVDVATVVSAIGRHELGLHQTCSVLQARDGRPLIMVDDIAKVTDDIRIASMLDTWKHDPYLEILRRTHSPAGDEAVSSDELDKITREKMGYRGDRVYALVLPILQTGEILGCIRAGNLKPFTPQLRNELTTLASHVSVRLAQLGITTMPCPLLQKLTPRQCDVALLAARGHTNAEIGSALGLSENTVKKHLKDIFDLLAIANRTELAARLSTWPQHNLPVGVTRRGSVWITRGPVHEASASTRLPSTSTQIPT